jgi:hypothetical protein
MQPLHEEGCVAAQLRVRAPVDFANLTPAVVPILSPSRFANPTPMTSAAVPSLLHIRRPAPFASSRRAPRAQRGILPRTWPRRSQPTSARHHSTASSRPSSAASMRLQKLRKLRRVRRVLTPEPVEGALALRFRHTVLRCVAKLRKPVMLTFRPSDDRNVGMAFFAIVGTAHALYPPLLHLTPSPDDVQGVQRRIMF